MSTGLSPGGRKITQWDLPSVSEWREKIHSTNDGTQPLEPWQRCSQAIFEAWLKPRIQAEPSIDSHFGMKLETLIEHDDHVECRLTEAATGLEHVVRSQYVVGCDGGGSRVRRDIGIKLTGGPTPMAAYLVHFKSRDLKRLHVQGQFWHIFFSQGAAIISQDEVDTWTTHLFVPVDTDISKLDPKESVYKVLGGSSAPYEIEIDEVLVTSSWRPNICLADGYRSREGSGRVFLSGDAAHQNIPTGGYGMNTAVGDSFDIGWKLAAVLKGFGGEELLKSYETERRPVAARNIEHSGVHMAVHGQWWEMIGKKGHEVALSDGKEGTELRERIKKYVEETDGENKDHGIELGYRYNDSPVVNHEKGAKEPEWSKRRYVPDTWPGARAPHVFLKDGQTSIYDLFGRDFTLVDFSKEGQYGEEFAKVAEKLQIPLKVVRLPDEEHVRKIWGRDAALIRPDDFVAWREPTSEAFKLDVEEILLVAVGRRSSMPSIASGSETNGTAKTFTSTVGNVDQEEVKMMAAFQK